MKKLALMLIISLCNACSFLQGFAPDDLLYAISAPTITVASSLPMRKSVLVEVPIAPQWLERNRIALRKPLNQQDYFAGVRWSAPLPNMLQETMIATLEKTGKLSVFSQRSGLPAEARLISEIRDFQVEYGTAGETTSVNLTFTASLVETDGQKLIASKLFSARQQLTNPAMASIIAAFDKASITTQTALVEWVISSLSSRF
jgi:cholesterol transport system auxiliary component